MIIKFTTDFKQNYAAIPIVLNSIIIKQSSHKNVYIIKCLLVFVFYAESH